VGGEDIVREAQALAASFEEKRQMQPKKKRVLCRGREPSVEAACIGRYRKSLGCGFTP
jgi:hypothetical protein